MTPFASNLSDEQVKFNILERNINWKVLPSNTPQACRDIIDSLLMKDPQKRLGQRGGEEVQDHENFADINFDHILSRPGPLIPVCREVVFEPLREEAGLYFKAASSPDDFFSL